MVKNIRASCLIAIESNSDHVLVLVCVRSWKLLRDGFVLSTKHIRKGNNSFFDPFLPRFFPTWCQLKIRILHVDAWQIYSGHIPPRIKLENSGAKEFNFCLCPNKRPRTNFWRALCLASGPFPEKKVNRNDKFSTTFFSSDITKRKQIFGMNALRSCDTA